MFDSTEPLFVETVGDFRSRAGEVLAVVAGEPSSQILIVRRLGDRPPLFLGGAIFGACQQQRSTNGSFWREGDMVALWR